MPRLCQSPAVIDLSHAPLLSLYIPTGQIRTHDEPIITQRLAGPTCTHTLLATAVTTLAGIISASIEWKVNV